MNAIRQIVEVKNHKINIDLPKDFNADTVEIIIFPAKEEDFFISEDEKNLMRDRLKNSKEEDFESWETIKVNYL